MANLIFGGLGEGWAHPLLVHHRPNYFTSRTKGSCSGVDDPSKRLVLERLSRGSFGFRGSGCSACEDLRDFGIALGQGVQRLVEHRSALDAIHRTLAVKHLAVVVLQQSKVATIKGTRSQEAVRKHGQVLRRRFIGSRIHRARTIGPSNRHSFVITAVNGSEARPAHELTVLE